MSGRMDIHRYYSLIKEGCMDLSLRARAYLASYTLANVVMGVLLVFLPNAFQSQSFGALRVLFPLPIWGIIYLVVGVVTFFGAYRGTEKPARAALLANLVTTGAFFAGFMAAMIDHTSSSPSGAIAWGLLTVLNLIMLSNPLRTPFEDLVNGIIEENE